MIEYIYPNNKKVFVIEQSIVTTPDTFRVNYYAEKESLEYFFNLVNSTSQEEIKIIADIGAQTGLYTIYANYLGNSKIYAFEPNPETYNILVENCKLNNINTDTLFQKGVGEKQEKKILHVPKKFREKGLCCLGENPIRFNEWYNVEVEITSIDDEFYNKDIPLHFIKCDTEGWELNVLKGGKKTLEKWKPDLFIEVNHVNLNQCNSSKEDLLNCLNLLGYKKVTEKDGENWHFTAKAMI